MPYTIKHRALPEYLEVHMKGTIVPGQELKEALERWSKVAELCKNTNRRLILVFLDLKGQHTTVTKFNLADGAAGIGWHPDYKLSVVVRGKDLYHHLLLTETVMNNLGFETKLFTKKREAKKWLLT